MGPPGVPPESMEIILLNGAYSAPSQNCMLSPVKLFPHQPRSNGFLLGHGKRRGLMALVRPRELGRSRIRNEGNYREGGLPAWSAGAPRWPAPLQPDEDYAVGASAPVDGCRSNVLENLYAPDVSRIHVPQGGGETESSDWHVVHHKEGLIVEKNGLIAPNPNADLPGGRLPRSADLVPSP